MFIPFIVTCDPTFDAGGLLDPKDSLGCLFRRGTPDMSAALLVAQSRKVSSAPSPSTPSDTAATYCTTKPSLATPESAASTIKPCYGYRTPPSHVDRGPTGATPAILIVHGCTMTTATPLAVLLVLAIVIALRSSSGSDLLRPLSLFFGRYPTPSAALSHLVATPLPT